MITGLIPLGLHWNPFGVRGTAKNASGDLLGLAGLSLAGQKFAPVGSRYSLSTNGDIETKTVVSEITTVSIRANSSYDINTESASDAARDKASGKAIASAAAAGGNVNVVRADTSNKSSNGGSISVETTVTYSDGSTEKSIAGRNSSFTTTGDGLARKRLDAIIGGALAESEVLAHLGISSPAGSAAAAAKSAPADVAVDAKVSSDIAVSLTYVAQGDQRSVSGIETGSGTALIAAFDPKSLTYGSGGRLATTKESMNFTGTINGGSLFSDASAGWLSGSIDESTKSLTTIAGPNEITIARESDVRSEFGTNPLESFVADRSSSATQTTFSGTIVDASGERQREQITVSESESSADVQLVEGDHARSSNWHHVGGESVSLSSPTATSRPADATTAVALSGPAFSQYA